MADNDQDEIQSDEGQPQAPNTTVPLDPLAGPDGGGQSRRLALFWRDQIEKIEDSNRRKRWIKRGRAIERRYRDERNRIDEEGQRRYNALWSNVEILTPAIYGRCPVPVAERRFRDKDPTGRGAAQILERALRNEIEINGFDQAMRQAVKDYLLPGFGVTWVRYEPEIEEGVSLPLTGDVDMEDSNGEIDEEPQDEAADKLRDTGDQVVRESCPVDYISWEDFYTFPSSARTWNEVFAVGKRVFMSYEQMKARFGRQIARGIPLQKEDRKKGQYDSANDEHEVKGELFEIWSKNDKAVFWVARGYEFLCDRKDDPLQLEFFYPCPRPIIANSTNTTIYPVPDYMQYQDQATQIDELTQRISMLAKACKVAGVYNAAAGPIKRLFDESVENQLIPVSDWAAFGAEGGGVAGNISLLPLKEIIGVINELQMIKEKTIAEMDRLTGITDIMRGTTDARETLGGQRLKTNSSGTRLQWRQNEVARLATDTLRIMADVMSKHFSDRSLIEASGALYEEGLGDVDMPSINQMMAQNSMPGTPPPTSVPPALTGPASTVPGAGPTPPMGGNVVPLRPGMPAPPMGGQPPMVPQQPDPKVAALMEGMQRIQRALGLIRNERLRGFRVDIEVDSTIYGDQAQEKGDRTEFVGAVTKFLGQAEQMAVGMPEMVPLLGKLLQFGVRGFRVGRDLETAIEDFCDEATIIAKRKAQQASQQPNPQALKLQAQAKQAEASGQAAIMQGQAAMVRAQNEVKSDQVQAESDAKQADAEVARQQIENQGEMANSQSDMAIKQIELRMKQMEMVMENMRNFFEMNKLKFQAENPPQEASLGNQPAKQAK